MRLCVRQKNNASLKVILMEIVPLALIVMVLVALGIVHVTSRVLVVRLGYELSKLDAMSVDLTRENDNLKLELATLKSPTRLESIGRSQLGLEPPSPKSVIQVKR